MVKHDPAKIIGKWLHYLWLGLSAAVADVEVAVHSHGQNLPLTLAAIQLVDDEMPLCIRRRIVYRKSLNLPDSIRPQIFESAVKKISCVQKFKTIKC